MIRDAMASVCPNLPIGCETIVSYRWHKSAETVRTPDGRLLPSDDRPNYA